MDILDVICKEEVREVSEISEYNLVAESFKNMEETWIEDEEASEADSEDVHVHDMPHPKDKFELNMYRKELKYIFDLDTTGCCDSEQGEAKLRLKIKDRYEFLNNCNSCPDLVTGHNYLRYLKGRVIPILKKKKGSILMLKYLLLANEEVLSLLVQEIMLQLNTLVNCCFASSFLESLLMVVNEEHQILILSTIYQNFANHLKCKFAIRFMISIFDLPFFANSKLLKIPADAITGAEELLSTEFGIKIFIALIRRLNYRQYKAVYSIYECKFDQLIKSHSGFSLLRTLLETQTDPEFFHRFIMLLAPLLSEVLSTEEGYDLCSRVVRATFSQSITIFNSITPKEKVEDTLSFICKGKLYSRLILRKVVETGNSCIVPFTTQLFLEASISSGKSKFTLLLFEMLIRLFGDHFIKRLIETILATQIVNILEDDTENKILLTILEVCKTVMLVEYIYRLLLEVLSMSRENNKSRLMQLIKAYRSILKTYYKNVRRNYIPVQPEYTSYPYQPNYVPPYSGSCAYTKSYSVQ